MSRKKHHILIRALPVYGCISTGIIYVFIGVIAILSFLRLREGGADETRLFALLSHYMAGKVLIGIILSGSLCYVIWRFYEAYADPYGYGKDFSGLAKRTGITLSTIADIMIIFSAFRFILGMGDTEESHQLENLREMTGKVLLMDKGSLFIISAGVVYMLTAVIQLYYGTTRGYRERLEVEEFSQSKRKLVHLLGLSGYASRGIILAITGYFYIVAGLQNDASLVVDTDKAFDFIGDNIGHLAFIVVAAGTIFYGLFMFILGTAYDIDRD
ncbi:MAG TPA: DUF1206 domain-containing protein [Bacteroidales bacterium]|nr:DUF1206 domain-containing protein [Bacteroidales bacterium]